MRRLLPLPWPSAPARWRRLNARRVPAVMLAVLMGASACSGPPRAPVAIGVREFPTDVLLGTSEGNLAPLEPSPVETNPLVSPPRRQRVAVSVTTGPSSVTSPGHALSACPDADPLSAPKLEAVNRATLPPVEASYPFRTEGTVGIGDIELGLPPIAIRTVQNVERVDDSTYTFEVLDELAGLKTLNRYRVVPRGELNLPDKGEAGVFITETVRGDGDDETTTFTWTPPIALARFPIEHGDEWEVHSTALESQVVMRFKARVGEAEENDGGDGGEDGDGGATPGIVDSKVRVNACGEHLDAWNIQVGVPDATGDRSGRYISPDTLLNFREAYAITPQYGGLVVMERRSASGVSSGLPLTQERKSIIDVVPERPEE